MRILPWFHQRERTENSGSLNPHKRRLSERLLKVESLECNSGTPGLVARNGLQVNQPLQKQTGFGAHTENFRQNPLSPHSRGYLFGSRHVVPTSQMKVPYRGPAAKRFFDLRRAVIQGEIRLAHPCQIGTAEVRLKASSLPAAAPALARWLRQRSRSLWRWDGGNHSSRRARCCRRGRGTSRRCRGQ